MIDSTPDLLLDEAAGTLSASPYGGGGRRAVMPEPASNPAIGQSPASPYAAGFTEPLVRRAASPRAEPSPAPVAPVSLASPVPAPSPVEPEVAESARLEEPSPYEASPYEASPTELSPTELSPTEPDPVEPESPEPEPTRAVPTEADLVEVAPTEAKISESEPTEVEPESEPVEPRLAAPVPLRALPEPADIDLTDPEPLEADDLADDLDDEEVEPVAADEPARAAVEPHPSLSIPWIPRPPAPSVTEDMSGAQAYTTPVDPGMWFIGPMEEAQAPPFVRVRHQGPERVRRGLLFAAIPLVVGWFLAAALFHFGHIPSIVALAMAPAGALLYGKGAGSRPQAGTVKLVALLVVGVLLAWPISLATELFLFYTSETGTSRGALGYVVSTMFSTSLFMAKLKELLLVALFGLGGVIAVVQTIVAANLRRRSEAS